MKRRVLSIAVSVCVLALTSVTAFAQLPGIPIRVNIPFDFSVRGRTFSAGQYEISRLGDEPDVLEISNLRNRHEHAAIETEPEQRNAPSQGRLVFHRYGDSYFLREIWTAGLETGRELPTSRQEKVLIRDTLAKGESGEPQTVAVAVY
jgi:hypothetical protein